MRNFFSRKPYLKRALEDKAYAGRLGEQEAAKLLKNKGFSILLKNWRHGKGEIDLICKDGEVLVFVEVRTRRADALVQGYNSITASKKKTLRQTGEAYLRQLKGKRPTTWRWDVVEIQLADDGLKINHLQSIPL